MSSHDHGVTLRQIGEYAGRAQEICAGKTLDGLIRNNNLNLSSGKA